MDRKRCTKKIELDTMYIVVSLFEGVEIKRALKQIKHEKEIQSCKLLEMEVKKLGNRLCIIETFIK